MGLRLPIPNHSLPFKAQVHTPRRRSRGLARRGWLVCLLALPSITACAKHPGANRVESRTPALRADEIVLGSSAALSGQSQFLGQQTLHGSLTRLQQVNESGGIHGRRIRVVSLDDAYEPAKAITNAQQLLVEEDVFALFDFVGTPTSVKIIELTSRAKVPALGFFTGAEPLRKPFRPWMFHVRDSYYAEAEAGIGLFVDRLKFRKIAVMYQEDAFGQAVLAGLQIALAKRNLKAVAIDTYVRGTLDVEKARDSIKASGADAVAMVGSYAPLAKFVKACQDANFRPWFHTVSFVGSEAFAKELVEKQGVDLAERAHIVVTQVVPSPFAETYPAVKEYRALAAKYFPHDPPNYVALEGFLNATVLVRALTNAGPSPTRETFVRALENLKELDIGIGHKLSYSGSSHEGLRGTYYSRLDRDARFQLFDAAEVTP
jgi:ABC-type branched-subunit amino acid transport system substrate-binding protein